jgi:hypothetical protein
MSRPTPDLAAEVVARLGIREVQGGPGALVRRHWLASSACADQRSFSPGLSHAYDGVGAAVSGARLELSSSLWLARGSGLPGFMPGRPR